MHVKLPCVHHLYYLLESVWDPRGAQSLFTSCYAHVQCFDTMTIDYT